MQVKHTDHTHTISWTLHIWTDLGSRHRTKSLDDVSEQQEVGFQTNINIMMSVDCHKLVPAINKMYVSFWLSRQKRLEVQVQVQVQLA
jgi:hypothetical protein